MMMTLTVSTLSGQELMFVRTLKPALEDWRGSERLDKVEEGLSRLQITRSLLAKTTADLTSAQAPPVGQSLLRLMLPLHYNWKII